MKVESVVGCPGDEVRRTGGGDMPKRHFRQIISRT